MNARRFALISASALAMLALVLAIRTPNLDPAPDQGRSAQNLTAQAQGADHPTAQALPTLAGDVLPPLEMEDGLDADFARAAVLRGEILPLERILTVLRSAVEGQIVEIQLEIEDGVLVYEFDLIAPDGHIFEVEIGAATGKILSIGPDDDDEDDD